ncbi:MAG: substrate-binding domain-containing protein [Microcoleus sp. PH2017_19_SFW_U_A]|nr:substrate-binding domain-containing protein [Microcoleus sp. PH2017_19_SFW_U_A]
MKRNLLILTLGAIALFGLPSCSTNASTSTATTVATAAAPTDASLKIGGSSSTIGVIQTLATNYESTSQNTKITQLEPGQSETVIAGVKQQLIDIGAISKTLKPEENDGTLEFREVAHDALLVATHPSVKGVKNLTTKDLKAIYSGTLTNWKKLGGPDAKIVVLDRPEDESAKRLLRKHYLGKDLKSSPQAVVFRKEGELIEAKLPVNRLSLNNVEPTAENVKAGKYQMVRPIEILWHKNASESTQGLIKYIFSPSGTTALEKSGFVVSK